MDEAGARPALPVPEVPSRRPALPGDLWLWTSPSRVPTGRGGWDEGRQDRAQLRSQTVTTQCAQC